MTWLKLCWTALLFFVAAEPGVAATPLVRTAAGALAGVDQKDVHAFLGIRFAQPPVGTLRWRPPLPVRAWSGVRAAQRFGHNCWQSVSPEGFGPWTHEYVVAGDISEDCLFLNVWAPARTREHVPVLVWIHGGGFNSGSGSIPIYDGHALAARGILVVTINYRVGPFGFLAHPELTREAGAGPIANFGLQDMIAALRWVQDNIGAFGGDPRQVTIAGQSAGSMAVHALIASPAARGLFARAIGESGLPDSARAPSLQKAEADGVAFAKTRGAASLAALRALPPDALVPATGSNQVRFTPVIDGRLLPGFRPVSRVPMLVGFNADEGSALGQDYGSPDPDKLKGVIAQSFGDAGDRIAHLYPATNDADRAESNRQVRRDRGAAALWGWARQRGAGPPIHAYLWTHAEPGPQSARWGAFHSSEIPYVFQTFAASPERGFTAEDRLLSDQLSSYWVNFVRTGDPNGPSMPHWPALNSEDPQVLAIGKSIMPRPILPTEKREAVRAWLARGGAPSLF